MTRSYRSESGTWKKGFEWLLAKLATHVTHRFVKRFTQKNEIFLVEA